MNRLKEKYEKEVQVLLKKEFGIKNAHQMPRVSKVVVNMGIGALVKQKELLEQAKSDLMTITGQAPSVRQARISVASFGVRKGMNVGLKITLRGDRMYSFLDKLFSIVLPRLRDFRGISKKSFDKNGNYSLGMVEHTVFPEIDIAKSKPLGLEITLVTTGGKTDQSLRMLELMGMPFEKEQ